MIRPRLQKVLSDLWGNRLRSLLVVASIAVGLFALGVMVTIYSVALDDMKRGYAEGNPSNITIQSSLIEQGLVTRVAALPGVEKAEASRVASTRIFTGDVRWTAIDITTFKDLGNMVINRPRLVEGVWPPAEREIVIDQFKYPSINAQLGETITIESLSGRSRQLKVVGIVQDQTIGAFRGSGGFFNAPVQGYVTQDTLEWLEQPLPRRYNFLYVTVTGDDQNREYLEQVSAQIRDDIEKNNTSILTTALRSSTDHPNLALAQAILAVLVLIGLLVVFLSGFLITNTLQALLNQQVQQIGILKSVGARRSQVIGIYMLLNLFYGVIALAISLPLSFQVAFSIINYLTGQMNNTFYGFRIVPGVVVLETVIALLMPQIAALVPVWQGTQISVQEALSGIRQDQPPNRGWMDMQFSRLRNYSMLLVISLRNTFRRKGRLLLTVLTLSLGGAVFIATFNVRVSLVDYLDHLIRYFLADVNITLDRPYRITEITNQILQVPGVHKLEGWAFARTELVYADGSVGESVALLAPPVRSTLVEPIVTQGRWLMPGDKNAIALSELFQDRFPTMNVGDTIRLKVNEEDTDWVVVGFYQLAGKISGFAAYTSYEYLTELTHQVGKSASYRVVSTQNGLDRYQQEALGRAIEAQLEAEGINVVDITAGKALSETASDGFNVLTFFLLFLALLTALVGSIGLAGTMSLNVMERTREVGVLRAIGASDRVLLWLVLVEGAFIGVLSWLLASLAAFPISSLLSEAISQSLFGGDATFGFSITGFIIWLGVVVVLSVLASVMPARSATRLTIREVLAYE